MLDDWKIFLEKTLNWFSEKNEKTNYFHFKLAMFFIIVNFTFFWIGLYTTYPHLLESRKAIEYQLMSIPVSLMGATFDFLSLYITIWIAKFAVKSGKTSTYFKMIFIDLAIAILATFWILFAFISSGWIVNIILENPETFNQRTELYERRLDKIFNNPLNSDNIKNLYFGILIGCSAFFPTLIHLSMAFTSITKWLFNYVKIKFFKRVKYAKK
jgi:hypothetical protein